MGFTIGLVDISSAPNQCRNKMQESDEMSCEFAIASGNASTPLEFVDRTFDDVAFSVAYAVLVPWLPSIAAGRDDHLYLAGCEQLSQWVRIVAFVGITASKSKVASTDFFRALPGTGSAKVTKPAAREPRTESAQVPCGKAYSFSVSI